MRGLPCNVAEGILRVAGVDPRVWATRVLALRAAGNTNGHPVKAVAVVVGSAGATTGTS